MVDPGLQIRGWGGGGGGGHPDSEISREGALKNSFFFRPFRPHFSLKIRGRASRAPPPDPPVYSLLVKTN